jgi:two-component system cell cycle response regulator
MTHAGHSDMPIDGESAATVLVIDDSPDVHRILHARLRQEGITFLAAHTGPDGVAMAAATQPALILLDLDMPCMHGLEVLAMLKADGATHDIPVIVVSGNSGPTDKVRAFDLGAVDYVTKPFEMTELRVRVRQALKMRQLIQMLAQRAQIDGLTNLWNRSFFDQRWSEEYARAVRYGHPLSLAIVDLDHFKSINDAYGHLVGDIVLCGVARILQRECRAHDLVCRFGGEEFVIVMPETSPEDAAQVCERIREAVEREVWERPLDKNITASIGVAGASRPAEIGEQEWVDAADRNLYAAKKTGRNSVKSTDVGSVSTAAHRPRG